MTTLAMYEWGTEKKIISEINEKFNQDFLWNWGTAPSVVSVSTTPSLILEATSQPRLISYRAEGDPSVKIKIWKNCPTTGPHELDSFSGHNIEKWELSSALKIATVSGIANVVINTANKVII